jgi:hypothetical protein
MHIHCTHTYTYIYENTQIYEELGSEEGVPGLITAHRRYIRTEDVLMRESSSSKNEKKRTAVYVFNDLIVLARGTGKEILLF